MEPENHANRYYPGVAHIPYNNRNAAFLKEMMVREDTAHEAWRTHKTYSHPRKPTIDVGLSGASTANLLAHDDAPLKPPDDKADVRALKEYERELKRRIAEERAAKKSARAATAELKGA